MSQDFQFDLTTAFNHTSLNISAADFFGRNPNEFYSGADIAWVVISSVLVLLMVPGLGLFYSGVSEECSSLSMMWLSMMTTSVIGLQWFLWGYTITFTGSKRGWGGPESFALHNDLSIPWGNKPGTKIPQLVYALFQGIGAIVSGAVIRKGRPLHFLVFIFIWSTFVYDPIARSTWNPQGWANYWKGETSGVFDFSGGTVVHIVSAVTAAVYSIFVKWRRQIFRLPPLQQADKDELNRTSNPHNVTNVILGTALLWIGWFGFNGGSALGINLRAVSACISTHLAACAGGATGTFIEYVFAKGRKADSGKFSIIGFCNGTVAGLVAITPAAGYVPYWSAPIFGITGSLCCAVIQNISSLYFDTNDILVIHGTAGLVGMLLTAGFARADIAMLDGYSIIINHKIEQLGIQLSDVVAAVCWSGFGTLLILIFMEAIIVGFRKVRGKENPAFQLILDADIIYHSELGGLVQVARSSALNTSQNNHVTGGRPGSGIGLPQLDASTPTPEEGSARNV
ncbi:ammonium transporter AmtB-like domain-containing protein [Bisporella sp. PMI_857]|nr:ammonium transporter AmtB-like domain-containing protein [Bisporella sp. PMI_857]